MSKNTIESISALQYGVLSVDEEMERTISPQQPPPQSKISIAAINVSAQFFQFLSDALMRTRNPVVTTMVNWRLNQCPADQSVDIVLLDLDGLQQSCVDFLGNLSAHRQTRIIVLSENCAAEKIVDYYAHGVDDYIIKPCTHQEVALRIVALMRRLTWSTVRSLPPALSIDGVIADNQANEARSSDYLIRLNPIEFQLLNAFMRKPDEAISAETLFREVWGYEVRGFQKLLDLAIRHLRTKVEAANPCPGQIYTVGTTHYRFCPPESSAASSNSPLLAYT
ncbi:MAG: response regulator transcription factor [Caldilineaceae bacterium]